MLACLSKEADLRRTIMISQSKSCALDPLPTNILTEFLPEILPFMENMCNTSLRQGVLSLSQRHAIVTHRLKKPRLSKTADPRVNLAELHQHVIIDF